MIDRAGKVYYRAWTGIFGRHYALECLYGHLEYLEWAVDDDGDNRHLDYVGVCRLRKNELLHV